MKDKPLYPILSSSDLGQLVRVARNSAKLTQQQFADLAGVGRRFLSECETGKQRLDLSKVLLVVKAAGIDLYARPR